MPDYRFRLELQVRDYELDAQGVVNNAVYQNYLEHCRHQFLLSAGIDFNRLNSTGVYLVVARAELDYKTPLRGGDSFWIGLNLERSSPLRFVFLQDIYRRRDDRLVLSARTTGTAVNARGRPCLPPEIEALLAPADPGGGSPGNPPPPAAGRPRRGA